MWENTGIWFLMNTTCIHNNDFHYAAHAGLTNMQFSHIEIMYVYTNIQLAFGKGCLYTVLLKGFTAFTTQGLPLA